MFPLSPASLPNFIFPLPLEPPFYSVHSISITALTSVPQQISISRCGDGIDQISLCCPFPSHTWSLFTCYFSSDVFQNSYCRLKENALLPSGLESTDQHSSCALNMLTINQRQSTTSIWYRPSPKISFPGYDCLIAIFIDPSHPQDPEEKDLPKMCAMGMTLDSASPGYNLVPSALLSITQVQAIKSLKKIKISTQSYIFSAVSILGALCYSDSSQLTLPSSSATVSAHLLSPCLKR